MPMTFSANRSTVQVDGETIEGLQSLVYRVTNEKEEVRAVGTRERVDVVFGLRSVRGELTIKSANVKLDTVLDQSVKCQIVAVLKRDEAADAAKRTLSFDDCYLDGKSFAMDASGVPQTTYSFTATRAREE